MLTRLPWREELAIVDSTMKAISGISDPEALVDAYWNGLSMLIPIHDYVAISRRNVERPYYLVTRSSRFQEQFNPWTQRDRLPRLKGGLLGEILDAGSPVIIEDLDTRLKPDDPGHYYLQGFGKLIALPQYDGGEALNVTAMLLPAGMEIDHSAIPILHWQSGLFGRGTQNLVLRNQLATVLAALDRELQVVGGIQRSLLPQELPQIPGFDLAAHYQTSSRAGGDYYDFFPLQDGRWGVMIADVSGHGTPAAVLMAITHSVARAKPKIHAEPAALLEYVNNRLTADYTRDGTFVTAFYGVIDPSSRAMVYASAGHNPPRLARRDRVTSLDKTGELPIGIMPDQKYTQADQQLDRGDLLLLYTDGITEAMAPKHASDENQHRPLFGVDRVDALLASIPSAPAATCVAQLLQEVSSFSGHAPAIDDQTLIAMRCEG